ncbi:MAG: aminotransferase class III-fold pyridoxal phosphate-dependent enzyme, partial [Planctomycetales bacterium]|nr:aminotransferase class III-fold pyridoxal phosphate-dependent enzyme [Planctomycetales bacterium]
LHCMPTAPGIPHGTFGEIIVLKYGSQESLEIIERYGDDIAAVLVEPVQARRLDLVPREFLQQLRVITEATGTALVFDEVVTGFRLEPGGAQAYFGIRADLATYGKVVGGGVPIGVVTGRAKFMDALDGGPWQYGDDSAPEVGVTFFAGTFVRHPLALAAAKGVLTKLKGEGPGLQQRVAQKANAVAVEFRKLFDKYRAPYHLSHFSSLVYVSVPPEFTYGGLLFYHLRERGIHIFENRLFIFSTEHTDDDCQKLLTAMQSSLEEMQREGFLPRAGEEMDERLPITAAKPAKLADGQIPLTAAQEEIWLAASMSDDLNCSYNQPLRLQFSGHLNIGAMRTALTQLVARHDALRIVVAADGQSQRVVSSLTLDVPLHDLTELSLEEQHAAWERLRDN